MKIVIKENVENFLSCDFYSKLFFVSPTVSKLQSYIWERLVFARSNFSFPHISKTNKHMGKVVRKTIMENFLGNNFYKKLFSISLTPLKLQSYNCEPGDLRWSFFAKTRKCEKVNIFLPLFNRASTNTEKTVSTWNFWQENCVMSTLIDHLTPYTLRRSLPISTNRCKTFTLSFPQINNVLSLRATTDLVPWQPSFPDRFERTSCTRPRRKSTPATGITPACNVRHSSPCRHGVTFCTVR